MAKSINTEHSYITFRIDRVKEFLNVIDCFEWNDGRIKDFELDNYFSKLDGKSKETHVIHIARKLPPSFFDFEVNLKSKNDDKIITFEDISSGDRQIYITISSAIYHSMNLIFVRESRNRVNHRNVLAILDEVELCYHSDFQKRFVERLLSIIKQLKFNDYLNYHILLTSHSPFILSDIPHTSILYLDDGRTSMDSDRFVNPFCADLNVILSQSFFLCKNGFIGEYAKTIVNSLHESISTEPKNAKKNVDMQRRSNVQNNRNIRNE